MYESQGIGCCAEKDVGAVWCREEFCEADERAVCGAGGLGVLRGDARAIRGDVRIERAARDAVLSKSAVVLLSGGLDSMVCAALAREAGFTVLALVTATQPKRPPTSAPGSGLAAG